jgi:xylulokinase
MFLGIDLGTSSVKVILIDLPGNVLGEADVSYPAYGIENGYFEQDPADWTSSILSAVAKLRKKLPEELWQSIEAIGLSAQMPTMVLMGKDGGVLGRAVVWCDARAEEQGAKLLDLWGEERHYCKTGVKLDGRYIIPMYKWIAEYKPEILARPHYILSAKDYLYCWMCGEAITDPSTASGFAVYNINTGDWDQELCSEAGISMKDLPVIMDSREGTLVLKEKLRSAFGLRGDIAVCVGAADSVAGVLGLGAAEPGTVCQICGSSTAIIGVCDRINMDPSHQFFVTPLAKEGTFGLEADILSTGRTSQWVAELVGKNPDELSEIAKKAPAGSEGVIFAPYLSGGEQGVLWDSSLSGGILGLSCNHNMSHIIRAHYEGICFEAKRCIDAFAKNDFTVKKVLMTGPVTKDSFFMQLMADILNRECVASDKDNASAYGAAILAGIRSGKIEWTFEALNNSKPESYRPDQAVSVRYDFYYKNYLTASANLKTKGLTRK